MCRYCWTYGWSGAVKVLYSQKNKSLRINNKTDKLFTYWFFLFVIVHINKSRTCKLHRIITLYIMCVFWFTFLNIIMKRAWKIISSQNYMKLIQIHVPTWSLNKNVYTSVRTKYKWLIAIERLTVYWDFYILIYWHGRQK